MTNYEEVYSRLKLELDKLISEYNIIENDYNTTTKEYSTCLVEIDKIGKEISEHLHYYQNMKELIYLGIPFILFLVMEFIIISTMDISSTFLLVSSIGTVLGATTGGSLISKLVMKHPKFISLEKIIENIKSKEEELLNIKSNLFDKITKLEVDLNYKKAELNNKKEEFDKFESMIINNFLHNCNERNNNFDNEIRDNGISLVRKKKRNYVTSI